MHLPLLAAWLRRQDGVTKGFPGLQGDRVTTREGRTHCSSQWGKKGNSNLSFLDNTGGKVFYGGLVAKVEGVAEGGGLMTLIAVQYRHWRKM